MTTPVVSSASQEGGMSQANLAPAPPVELHVAARPVDRFEWRRATNDWGFGCDLGWTVDCGDLVVACTNWNGYPSTIGPAAMHTVLFGWDAMSRLWHDDFVGLHVGRPFGRKLSGQ